MGVLAVPNIIIAGTTNCNTQLAHYCYLLYNINKRALEPIGYSESPQDSRATLRGRSNFSYSLIMVIGTFSISAGALALEAIADVLLPIFLKLIIGTPTPIVSFAL